jgi:NTE family protein
MGLFDRKSSINLALQGGGAHGAFTWGVLDRLLEDETLPLAWISGTSAGAVNAVALASGLALGGRGQAGRQEARAVLRRVWEAVEAAGISDLARLNPFLYGLTRAGGLSSMGSLLSPYDFNPLGFDPFRKLLADHIDFARLRTDTASGIELLIAATDVSTGRPRIFRRSELTVECVLASACLPQIHHAVEIEGRHYWDGGFSANPDVLTLAAESPARDTLIVQLNPLERPGTPRTARDIAARINAITFNQPLLKDVETIVAAQAERRRSWFSPSKERLARIGRHRFHLIDASRHTAPLGAATKTTPERGLLGQLFQAGRTETSRFLERHLADIGRRQTADLARRYLSSAAAPRTAPDQPGQPVPDDDEAQTPAGSRI